MAHVVVKNVFRKESIGFIGLLTIALVSAKVKGLLDIEWLWVFAPLWWPAFCYRFGAGLSSSYNNNTFLSYYCSKCCKDRLSPYMNKEVQTYRCFLLFLINMCGTVCYFL